MTATLTTARPAGAARAPAAPPGAATELLDQVLAETLTNLDRSAKLLAEAIRDPSVGHLQRAVLTARSINRLRTEITEEIMDDVYALMNCQLGFKTDRPTRQKPPYTKEEVKEVFILSLLNGLYPTGNEWNVIAGGLMIVQNGWKRLCRELPGLSNLEVSPGVPRVVEGAHQVRVGARWHYQGKALELHAGNSESGRVYVIPAYESTGPDAVVGKALRRAYRDVYQMTVGSDWLVGANEADDELGKAPVPVAAPASKTEALAARLEGQAAEPGSAAEAPEVNLDLERDDAVLRIAEQIDQVDSLVDLERGPGAELRRAAEWLGPERHQRLLVGYQGRYRQLQAAERRAAI